MNIIKSYILDVALPALFLVSIMLFLAWALMCPSEYDYWCPNDSGTSMCHHLVNDEGDTIIDSYPIQLNLK